MISQREEMMDIVRRRAGWTLLLCFLIACGGARTSPVGAPMPDLPAPPIVNPSPASSWTFNYMPGALRYQVSRSAAIESQSDSSPAREISTNTTRELITLTPAGDTIHFTAIVDTFSTITQGTIGPVQSVPLPVQLSGSFVGDSLIISVDSTTEKCNPVSSALSADLHNLLVRFPAQLSQGSNWRDSAELTACQGMIPTTVHIARSYLVSGETAYQGESVLLIQRTDSIHAHGEGAQQQHHVILDASGTGNAIYYVSPKDGRIVRVNTGQDLDLVITASGKIHRFKQNSKQEFNFVR